MTIEAPGRQVIAVQMLRGIAATMVVFFHINVQLIRLHFAPLHSAWMASGVDIFFVISGFIMWTSVEARGGMSAGAFIRNRLIRIVPLYWLLTAFVVAVALIAPETLKSTVLVPSHALASFFFVPVRHPIFDSFWPLLIPGWTLNYEMFFYLLFAMSLALCNGSRVIRFVLIASLLVGSFLMADLLMRDADVLHFYANPILLEFLVGVALGVVWNARVIRRSYAFTLIVAAGFFTLWAGAVPVSSLPLTIVGSALIVGGAVFLPTIRWNALSALGDASYSLYLSHGISLAALAWLWAAVPIDLGGRTFVVFAVPCSIAVAFVMYRYFEMPVTAALKSFRVRSLVAVQPVSGA